MKKLTVCAYCLREVPDGGHQDWQAVDWQHAAQLHASDCEWILTRAHSLQLEHDTEAVLIHGVTGQPVEHDTLPAGTYYALEATDAPAGPRTCINVCDYRYEVDASALDGVYA